MHAMRAGQSMEHGMGCTMLGRGVNAGCCASHALRRALTQAGTRAGRQADGQAGRRCRCWQNVVWHDTWPWLHSPTTPVLRDGAAALRQVHSQRARNSSRPCGIHVQRMRR